MKIQAALKSKNYVRRRAWGNATLVIRFDTTRGDIYARHIGETKEDIWPHKFSARDVLADDWEVEDRRIEVARTKLIQVLEGLPPLRCRPDWIAHICKELDLE